MENIIEKLADIGVVIFFSILPVTLFVIAPIIGIWEEKFPKSWKKAVAFWMRHEALQKVGEGIVLILLLLALFGAAMHMEISPTAR